MDEQALPGYRRPPAGNLTLLLVDVEGSTRLWAEHPTVMSTVMERHHALARGAIERHGGYRPPDQGEGDSTFAVFEHSTAAVACALEFQRAVLSDAWPAGIRLLVRMALHTGEVELRDDRQNYYGLAISRGARLRSAGHGGQTLVSEATATLIAGRLPTDAGLRDLGLHRFKDLSTPERVFQLTHPSLPDEFPPIHSLDVRLHNLPVPLTRFIGRAREMSELEHHLGTNRLVTLSGPGGCGKTRLALQVGGDLVDRYSDGVWFVELAAVADPALVPRVIASVLAVREQPGRPILATLVDALARKKLLLLLDNCEHITAACAHVVGELLAACPDLSVLATSREPLDVAGEVIWRVSVLSAPSALVSVTAASITQFEAVQLFVDRAHAADPSFALTDANAATVAAICRRLDGIPLALELAAARVQALTVEDVGARLDHRFRLLTAGSRTTLAHHRTLRAAIDWSHELLSEQERLLLCRLAVFAGGFTLAAAERVCAVGAVKPDDILEILSGLVRRSLILLERRGQEGRYRLLETIREYALEKLRAAGEEAALRERHLAWCIAFAEQAEPELRGRDQRRWLERLHADLDNFRAAFVWSLFMKQPAQALRLASALLEFWIVRADWSEGRSWVEDALNLPGEVDDSVRMKALRAAGELADVLSDYPTATSHYEESLVVARRLGDTRGTVAALLGLAHEAQRIGTFAVARPLVEESVARLRELGDEPSLARSLGGLAWLEDHYPRARSLWEQNLAIRRRLGNQESVGWSAINVGSAAQGAGDYAAARAAYEESLAIGRELDYKRMIARALTQLGEVERLEGNVVAARAFFEQTISTWREIGHKSGLVDALRGLGDVARLDGRFSEARALLEESLAICRDIGARPGIAAALESLADLALTRGDREDAALYYGEALSLWEDMDHAHGIARCIRGLAELVATDGRFDVVAMLLGGSESLREQIGASVPPDERLQYERVVAVTQNALGGSVFVTKWDEGRRLGRQTAVLARRVVGQSIP